jgi:hypothetical protein
VALQEDDGSPVMQPWDTSLIPNFPDLNPALQAYGNIDGQQYFIVADWGFAAPMYRADKISPEASWGALFDEQYAGRISWWDSLNMFIPAGLYLGIPEPYAMTDEELDQTTQFLKERVPYVRTFWTDDPAPDLVNGDVDIAYAWPDLLVLRVRAVRRHRELPSRARVRRRLDEHRLRGVADLELRLRPHEHGGGPGERAGRPGGSLQPGRPVGAAGAELLSGAAVRAP